MLDKIYTCNKCGHKFTFQESWNSSEVCNLYHNMPYKHWSTINMACPKCLERLIEEINMEVIN